MNRRIALASSLFLFACTGGPGGPDLDPDVEVPAEAADAVCSDLFQQNVFPEYHVTISDGEWAKLEDEFLNVVERQMAGMEEDPYHPIQLEYRAGDEVVTDIPDVLIRLKGASSWLQTIELDANPKMQFVIAFNEVDPQGRFKGVRKVELDMPRTDTTFLRHRMGLMYLREAGLPAQCANSARLYINGEYYGLYTHIERLDKEFLEDRFEGYEDGDLWKSGRVIKTNEDDFSWDRLESLWNITTPAEFDALADEDAAMEEWASEAMIGDADGYWNGRANFFLYDHPTRGFVWLPHDLDTTLAGDFLPADTAMVFPPALARWERDWHHYMILMKDDGRVDAFTDALVAARDHYDEAKMQERLELWTAQISEAAADEPHKPFTLDDHYYAVDQMNAYIVDRATYVDTWLDCRTGGGGEDGDGDGFDLCHECNDKEAAIHPNAAETCDLVDNDCDGRVDNIDGATVCQQ